MVDLISQYRGELAALLAAGFWAIASVIYGQAGLQLPPLVINALKNIVAIGLLSVTLVGQTVLAPDTTSHLTLQPTLLLMLSGIIGISIGDTAYLQTLTCLGARRALLLEVLAPPIAAILAMGVLREFLTVSAWMGIGLTLIGVAWVMSERAPIAATIGSIQLWRGLGFGLIAEVSQAIGAVISRLALTEMNINPLWSALLRITAATGFIGLLWLGQQWRLGRLGRLPRSPQNQPSPLPVTSQPRPTTRQIVIRVAIAAIFGTYLGIWLQQISLKFAPTGIAQALSATSPLFVLPIVAMMGETISWRTIGGVLIALAGIWLLFLS